MATRTARRLPAAVVLVRIAKRRRLRSDQEERHARGIDDDNRQIVAAAGLGQLAGPIDDVRDRMDNGSADDAFLQIDDE